MSTRQFRTTSDGTAFDVEVSGDSVRLREATEDGAPNRAEVARAGASHEASSGRAFEVTSDGADGLRIAPAPDGADASVAPTTHGARASAAHSAQGADARAKAALVASNGDRTWVWIDGDAFTIEVETAERARRPRAAGGAEGLSAPMPATVIRILAEPGKDVRRGETLLLLEAMKMELPVRAPRDGRVKALHCQPGELVQPGVTLVDLE